MSNVPPVQNNLMGEAADWKSRFDRLGFLWWSLFFSKRSKESLTRLILGLQASLLKGRDHSA